MRLPNHKKGNFFYPTLEERIRPRIFAQNQPIRNRWVQKPRMHMCTSQMNFQKSTFDHQCVGLVSTLYLVDDELKNFLQFLLTNDRFKPPNYKKLICFTLVCLWNVQIQILNQPKRPSQNSQHQNGNWICTFHRLGRVKSKSVL